jgi:hypothetical protein
MLTYADFFPYRPKRLLEQIKGISEQKANKVLFEGKAFQRWSTMFTAIMYADFSDY